MKMNKGVLSTLNAILALHSHIHLMSADMVNCNEYRACGGDNNMKIFYIITQRL